MIVERDVPLNLSGRHLLTLKDYSQAEIRCLLDLAIQLKADKADGREIQRLQGRNIALIFEKASTRTRCAFEVAAYDQGAHVTCLGEGAHVGKKESIRDTARVLGRMYDGIQYRGFAQENVELLARYAGVPVWNGLTDDDHPTQVLADIMTMMEHCDKPLGEMCLAYLGDARNNVAHALLTGLVRMGVSVRLAAPAACQPSPSVLAWARREAEITGADIMVTEHVRDAVDRADFLYTDVWVSMGEPESVWAERIPMLRPYQINEDVLMQCNHPDVRVLHCLPAFHNRDTEVGAQVYEKYGLEAMEITDSVFESPQSIVFDQAENRMHSIKSVIVATLGPGVDG
jgi:ornithine carbamoyltransferase